MYLEPHEADQLIQWCVNAFASKGSGIVIYEPIKNSDSFGKMMVKNLAVNFHFYFYYMLRL